MIGLDTLIYLLSIYHSILSDWPRHPYYASEDTDSDGYYSSISSITPTEECII